MKKEIEKKKIKIYIAKKFKNFSFFKQTFIFIIFLQSNLNFI